MKRKETLEWFVYHLNDFILLVVLRICHSFKSSKLTHDSETIKKKKKALPQVAQLVKQMWVGLTWKLHFCPILPHQSRKVKFCCFSEGWGYPLSWVSDIQLLPDVSAGLAKLPRSQCYGANRGYSEKPGKMLPPLKCSISIAWPNGAETNLYWVTAWRNPSSDWLFDVGSRE